MLDSDLDAIEARANAATPGPWEANGADVTTRYISHGKGLVRWQIASYVDPRDLTFIAHAREDVPALVAEVRRLRGIEQEMEDLEEQLQDLEEETADHDERMTHEEVQSLVEKVAIEVYKPQFEALQAKIDAQNQALTRINEFARSSYPDINDLWAALDEVGYAE